LENPTDDDYWVRLHDINHHVSSELSRDDTVQMTTSSWRRNGGAGLAGTGFL
jgi:hypothetical protein